jgi:hypothetical protein
MSDETMMWDEVADIGALLHELDDEAFDTPSLCHGWAVRDGSWWCRRRSQLVHSLADRNTG